MINHPQTVPLWGRPTPSRMLQILRLFETMILWLCRIIGRPMINLARRMRPAWPPVSQEYMAVVRVGIAFLLFVIILGLLVPAG